MGEQVGARSNGDVAQLGEHLPCKQGVMSSNLIISIGKSSEELASWFSMARLRVAEKTLAP